MRTPGCSIEGASLADEWEQKFFGAEKTKGSFNNRMSLEIPQSG
jgi:hypothetical protein